MYLDMMSWSMETVIVESLIICRASHVIKYSKLPGAKIKTNIDLKISLYVVSAYENIILNISQFYIL